MYLRLRQLCLVAQRLEPVVDTLCAVFGVHVCYRDPVVAQFGLCNSVMPFGTSFVEVVAPVAEGTAAGRYLARRAGDGGYMVILDSDGLARWRGHAATVGVRIAAELSIGAYEGIQFHPRDTGGALLEINHTHGGQDLDGPYGPAGRAWPSGRTREPAHRITGATVQSPDPARLARRWAEILQCTVTSIDGHPCIALDNATLRFIDDADGRGEGLAAIHVDAVHPGAVRARAASAGCLAGGSDIAIGGVRFSLQS